MKFKTLKKIGACLAVLGLLGILPAGPAEAAGPLSTGATVYVSIYSNIYSGPRGRPYQLGAMLSVRNTDLQYPITVLSAIYYNTRGEVIRNYIAEPLELGPLASKDYYIKEKDKTGGTGANFIVQWQSSRPVNQPIIEALMLGLTSGQGISFICPGKIITCHE